jgi:hypothetical protein
MDQNGDGLIEIDEFVDCLTRTDEVLLMKWIKGFLQFSAGFEVDEEGRPVAPMEGYGKTKEEQVHEVLATQAGMQKKDGLVSVAGGEVIEADAAMQVAKTVTVQTEETTKTRGKFKLFRVKNGATADQQKTLLATAGQNTKASDKISAERQIRHLRRRAKHIWRDALDDGAFTK